MVVFLLALYRLGRCALAVLGLASWIGTPWALVLALLAAALRWTLLLQLAALLALLRLWHWPLWLALIATMPRLLLVLPGLITTWRARWVHPRPRWSPPAPAMRAAGGAPG